MNAKLKEFYTTPTQSNAKLRICEKPSQYAFPSISDLFREVISIPRSRQDLLVLGVLGVTGATYLVDSAKTGIMERLSDIDDNLMNTSRQIRRSLSQIDETPSEIALIAGATIVLKLGDLCNRLPKS